MSPNPRPVRSVAPRSLAVAASAAVLALAGCHSDDAGSRQAGHSLHRSDDAAPMLGMVEPREMEGIEAVTEPELHQLMRSIGFTDGDLDALRRSRTVLAPRVEEVVDDWYEFVGERSHLLRAFEDPKTGEPVDPYLEDVRARYEDWVLDTTRADFDQAWLNRQLAYGLRHHRLRKNETDDVDAAPHVPFRQLVALVEPLSQSLRPHLAATDRPEDEVDAMQEAWRKTILLTAILWSQPYVRPRDY